MHVYFATLRLYVDTYTYLETFHETSREHHVYTIFSDLLIDTYIYYKRNIVNREEEEQSENERRERRR